MELELRRDQKEVAVVGAPVAAATVASHHLCNLVFHAHLSHDHDGSSVLADLGDSLVSDFVVDSRSKLAQTKEDRHDLHVFGCMSVCVVSLRVGWTSVPCSPPSAHRTNRRTMLSATASSCSFRIASQMLDCSLPSRR